MPPIDRCLFCYKMTQQLYLHACFAARSRTRSSGTSSNKTTSGTGGGGGASFRAFGSTARLGSLFLCFLLPSSGLNPHRAFSRSLAWFKCTGNPSRIQPNSEGTRLWKARRSLCGTLSSVRHSPSSLQLSLTYTQEKALKESKMSCSKSADA